MEIKLLPEQNAISRIELIGRLTHDGWSHWADPLIARLGDDVYSKRLAIGLRQSMYFDSTGVEWLIHWNRRFRQDGGRMVLHSANPATQQLFKMMRMDKILEIEATEADALKRLEENHASRADDPQPAGPQSKSASAAGDS